MLQFTNGGTQNDRLTGMGLIRSLATRFAPSIVTGAGGGGVGLFARAARSLAGSTRVIDYAVVILVHEDPMAEYRAALAKLAASAQAYTSARSEALDAEDELMEYLGAIMFGCPCQAYYAELLLGTAIVRYLETQRVLHRAMFDFLVDLDRAMHLGSLVSSRSVQTTFRF